MIKILTGEEIKFIRTMILNMSMGELAKHTYLTKQTISNIEAGKAESEVSRLACTMAIIESLTDENWFDQTNAVLDTALETADEIIKTKKKLQNLIDKARTQK